MVKTEDVKILALLLEGVEQKPHFKRIAFTVKKKIFATLSEEEQTLNVALTPASQFIVCPPESDVVVPLDNKWGRQGWTTIHLEKAGKKLVQSVLRKAYEERKMK